MAHRKLQNLRIRKCGAFEKQLLVGPLVQIVCGKQCLKFRKLKNLCKTTWKTGNGHVAKFPHRSRRVNAPRGTNPSAHSGGSY